MSGKPWIKWHPGDFLHGVTDLEPNELAAYVIILNLIYDQGSPIVYDEARLARRLRMRVGVLRASVSSLIQHGKLTLDGGLLDNVRARKVLESRAERSVKASESAQSRWSGDEENHIENNAIPHANASASHNDRDTEQEQEPEREKISAAAVAAALETDWPSGGMEAWKARLYGVAGPGLADPAKEPSLTLTAGEIVRWHQAGCSWDLDVIPVVQAKTQRARAKPIRTWTLLTEDVMDAKARRLRPEPEPETTDGRRLELQPPGVGARQPSRRAERMRDDLQAVSRAMAGAVRDASG